MYQHTEQSSGSGPWGMTISEPTSRPLWCFTPLAFLVLHTKHLRSV